MADLAHVLRHLPPRDDPNLLGGVDIGDDAGIYRLSDQLALVQTVDFFTPIVDDPYAFGQIAAANALSDIYAVGGRPLTALNIVGFPIKTLPSALLGEILRGGAAKAAEAGVTIVGGHTVDDEEPKYGLAVTGIVDPERFLSGRGAKSGDLLVLTKPIGSGVVTTALKAGRARPDHIRQAVRWMSALNRRASAAMLSVGAHAATDITGFGLLGHLSHLCLSSRVAAVVEAAAVPILSGAIHYARQGHVPGGTLTNLSAVEAVIGFDPEVDELSRLLLADPQTSGGLLVCLAADDIQAFRRAAGNKVLAAIVGRIGAGEPGSVRVHA